MRTVSIGETDADKLNVYFDLYQLDGTTPALTEAGGQPQISINNGAFNTTGIGVLTHIGFGRYVAILSQGILTNENDVIVARYKSGSTLEARSEPILVSGVLVNTVYNTTVASNNSYATIAEADAYFRNRLKSEVWFDSSFDERRKALIQATAMIDRLNFAGTKVIAAQPLQFPRLNTFYSTSVDYVTTQDTLVPADIKIASYILAYALLDDVEVDTEVVNLMKTSSYYHQARSNYDRESVQEHIRNGIPSFEAWTYLKPYLRDVRELQLVRL